MLQEFRNGKTATRTRAMLPDPFYYLNNFQAVLASIAERYAALLSAEERQFIASFGALPRASRALLVRMVTREGALFRRSRLNYQEIGATSAAAAPLVHLGWVNETPALDVEQLQTLLTKAELLDNFPVLRTLRALTKPALVAFLQAQNLGSKPFHEWCKESSERVYHLAVAPLCERFRLMFFGNFHQDWSEFVLTDLGVFAYEKIPASLQSPAFRRRAHIDTFEQLYRCRQQLEGGVAMEMIAKGIPAPTRDCDWLEERRQSCFSKSPGPMRSRIPPQPWRFLNHARIAVRVCARFDCTNVLENGRWHGNCVLRHSRSRRMRPSASSCAACCRVSTAGWAS